MCNTTGPRCICQQHWARTYGLVSALFEKPSEETDVLTQLAGLAQLCATMRKCKLVTVEEQPVVKPYNPIQLKSTVWDKQIAMLPKQQGNSEKLELYDNRIIDLRAEASKISKELGITVEWVPHNLQLTTDAPRSILKDHSTARQKFKTCMRYTEFDPQTAASEDIDELETVISDFRGKLDKPETANDLTMILGEEFQPWKVSSNHWRTGVKKQKSLRKR